MGDEQSRPGRPRSEQARIAVLHAVDDLLVEVGYAALTMKAIAERAGVGRQTVYRWWSTKAEVLFEAAMTDAGRELVVPAGASTHDELVGYLQAVEAFLTTSDAGAGYRALLGEAQHDPVVATMMRGADLFEVAVAPLVDRATGRGDLPSGPDVAAVAALLTGPLLFAVITGSGAPDVDVLARATLAAIRELPGS